MFSAADEGDAWATPPHARGFDAIGWRFDMRLISAI